MMRFILLTLSLCLAQTLVAQVMVTPTQISWPSEKSAVFISLQNLNPKESITVIPIPVELTLTRSGLLSYIPYSPEAPLDYSLTPYILASAESADDILGRPITLLPSASIKIRLSLNTTPASGSLAMGIQLIVPSMPQLLTLTNIYYHAENHLLDIQLKNVKLDKNRLSLTLSNTGDTISKVELELNFRDPATDFSYSSSKFFIANPILPSTFLKKDYDLAPYLTSIKEAYQKNYPARELPSQLIVVSTIKFGKEYDTPVTKSKISTWNIFQ